MYSGDGNYLTSTSADLPFTVNTADTTTSVTSATNPWVTGQAVDFTATVVANLPGAGTPTGTVTFTMNGGPDQIVNVVNGSATATLTPDFIGGNTVTAVYSGDGDFKTSTGWLTQNVNLGDTNTVVTNTPATSQVGETVTLSATVTAAAPAVGTPAGNVQFFDGLNPIGSPVALASGTVSIPTTFSTVGAHSITAQYLGAFNFNGSISPAVTQTVTTGSTATVVTVAQTPVVFGNSVTFQATVSPFAPATGTPTGTVQFTVDGVNAGAAQPLTGGTASVTLPFLTGGTHGISAVYTSDAPDTFGGSTGNTATQVITPTNTATTVSPSVANPVHGQPVDFTASVDSFFIGTTHVSPTGSVQFKIDGANVGSPVALTTAADQPSTAVLSAVSNLSTADHTVSAEYIGDANYATSTSSDLAITVAKADTTTTVTSPGPSVIGQPVSFTATVGAVSPGAGTPTGSVTFTLNGAQLQTVNLTGGQANITYTPEFIGNGNTVLAIYSGDGDFTTSQGSFNQVVANGNTTTVAGNSPATTLFGQTVTLSADVAAVSPATGTPQGDVSFFDGATLIQTTSLDGSGHASITTSSLAVGSHSITAVYATSSTFNGSTSAPVIQTVTTAETATVVTVSSPSVVFGNSVSFQATVATVAPATGTPTGTLQFTVDGVDAGAPQTLSGGAASVTLPFLTGGTHSISAAYTSDAPGSFANSLGNTVTQVITPADTATTVSPSVANPVHGEPVSFTASVDSFFIGTTHVSPTGSVQFTIDGANVGSPVALTPVTDLPSTATLPAVSDLSTAGHTVSAVYLGDTNYATSTSSDLPITVGAAATTTSVVSPGSTQTGQPVSFTATVTTNAPGAGTPVGSVTFTADAGAVFIGTSPLSGGSATSPSISSLSAGSHTITATYSGSVDFQGSLGTTSQSVGAAATTTALESSLNPSIFSQAIGLTATVTVTPPASGTATGTVQFLDGATSLGTVAVNGGGQAFLPISTLTGGAHSLTAVYTPADSAVFATSTSPVLTQTVNTADTSVGVTTSNSSPVYPDSVTLTATVGSFAGIPSGTVDFTSNGTPIGSAPLVAGATNATAAITVALPAGSQSVVASYSGDTNFTPSTSGALSFVVAKADQTITFAPLPDGVISDGSQPLNVSASSGLPVTLVATSESASVCHISGSSVVYDTVGICGVWAYQNGDANCNAAAPVGHAFYIAPAAQPQTITFAPLPDGVISRRQPADERVGELGSAGDSGGDVGVDVGVPHLWELGGLRHRGHLWGVGVPERQRQLDGSGRRWVTRSTSLRGLSLRRSRSLRFRTA